MVVAKIVMGLGQVVSKQPEVVKQDFPGPQWNSKFLALFSVDFGWIAPICTVPYGQKFLLNTVLMPLALQALVYVTWWYNERADRKAEQQDTEEPDQELRVTSSEHAKELEAETKASKAGDYYFAFFLVCTSQQMSDLLAL